MWIDLENTNSNAGLPRGSDGKDSACNAGGTSSVPVRKVPWGREKLPLPYACLENPMEQGAWCAYSPWGHRS